MMGSGEGEGRREGREGQREGSAELQIGDNWLKESPAIIKARDCRGPEKFLSCFMNSIRAANWALL